MAKSFLLFLAIGSTLSSAVAIPSAEARRHGHSFRAEGPSGGKLVSRRFVNRDGGDASIRRSVQTSGGYGYKRSRDIDREPGQSHLSRSFQTNAGRGWEDQRQRNWSEGHYSASASREYNNGKRSSRSVTAHDNGDGTATYNATRTRIDGSTRTRSGTVPNPRN